MVAVELSFEQQQAQERIVRGLLAVLPPGALGLELRAAVLVGAAAFSIEAIYEPRRAEPVDPRGQVTVDDLDRLRAAMTRPGAGTWFSLALDVSARGAVAADFDFDGEPRMGIDRADPRAYLEDAERFPRDAAHQPAWLAERLAAARALQPRSRADTEQHRWG